MKIIGISGRKQSGKNTVANCLHGIKLKQKKLIVDYDIDQSGNLLIKTTDKHNNIGWGVFDLLRKDKHFIQYAEHEIWPYIKIYHFADYLKQMCVDLFDIQPHQVYGTDDDKNTETPYNMTAREFLQYLGTDVMRKIKDSVWLDYTIQTTQKEGTEIAIIPDVRFPNEVEAIKKSGGILLRLTRDVHHSDHHCETALDCENFDWNNFNYVIENNSCSVTELKSKIEEISSKIL